jgi:Cap4 SAVED domain
MDNLINTLKNIIFKFEVDMDSCQPDEALFHLDYKEEKYTQKALLTLIKKSVMYFALTPQEFEEMSQDEIHEMSPVAWTRISTAHKNSKGDYGELLLYLILTAFYPAERFVTKVRLRSNQADQIKGFDCAHFSLDSEGILNFWLGEAKFRSSFSDGVNDAFKSLSEHCNYDFISHEFKILAPNLEINRKMPEFKKLQAALREEHSFDRLRFVFPILITYDSTAIKNSKAIDDSFIKVLTREMKRKYSFIREKWKTERVNFRFIFILFPLDAVAELKESLDIVEKAHRDD